MEKILIIIAVGMLVAIACVICWTYGFKQGLRAGGLTSNLAELMLANQHMTDQFTNANCDGVKQAINDYLKLIDKNRGKDDVFLPETTYYGDVMIGNIRLARIEGHRGNKEEEKRHLAIAKEACEHRKWKDCSEEKLIYFSRRLEEKNPITCLSNEK